MKRVIKSVTTLIVLTLLLLPANVLASDNYGAGIVSVNDGRLNVRSSASYSSPIIAKLYSGTYLRLIAKTGSWWRVEYGDSAYGYCHDSYIVPVSGTHASVNTSGSRLNVRSGAGTNYPIISALDSYDTITVLSRHGAWSRILYHGSKLGYASSNYLASATYSPVYLDVPNFKQTDARWSGTYIGNSGKTMSQIGCATTALAMTESYRTGRRIYPHEMSYSLKYTSSGSVYWPDNYIASTDGSGYLWRMYTALKEGKPVLLGLKNSAGSQHWIVVTGYRGGSSLTPSGFTVNDPGSSYRSDLQTVINAYPYFYKQFIYN